MQEVHTSRIHAQLFRSKKVELGDPHDCSGNSRKCFGKLVALILSSNFAEWTDNTEITKYLGNNINLLRLHNKSTM